MIAEIFKVHKYQCGHIDQFIRQQNLNWKAEDTLRPIFICYIVENFV